MAKQAVVWHLKKKKYIYFWSCILLPSGWQMVPRQPDQQAATQCSLNPTEMCANAFSKWPLLLYLITQSSVNLYVIVVCHGEAHLARVWELSAAGCLTFAAHLEPCSTGFGLRQCQLSWQWLENIFPPCLLLQPASDCISFFFVFFSLNVFWQFDIYDPDESSAIVAVVVAVT